jgi:glycosyltransferase involved in cell wall biosynthesis
MKLLFYFPDESHVRGAPLSYTSLLSGTGFSGTETALLELSNYLVKKGHSVTIAGVGNTYTDHGVQYISQHKLNSIDIDFDWYSPIFFTKNHGHNMIIQKLNPTRTKVFIWFQCFIDNNDIRLLQSRFQVYGQYLCNYVGREYVSLIPQTNSWVIYNGISDIFHTPTPPSAEEKRGNWVFHPVFERGGSVAQRIFNKMHNELPHCAQSLKLMSYHTPDSNKIQSNDKIQFLGSKTKEEVRNILLKSDYFIYPLVLNDGRVHHDTFGSVMLEALACGVIVIVWDVACISDIYGDHVVSIPVPDHVKHTYNPKARFASCPWMLSDDAIQMFADKIKDLESHPDQKEMIRQRGAKWAQTITWDSLGEKMEHELRSKLV